jgi:hypothetical protein
LLAALAAGFALGGFWLRLPVSLPPTNALGRLACIVVPLAISIEVVAACWAIARRYIWCWRLILALAVGRILLHGSVYVSADKHLWSDWRAATIVLLSGALLLLAWNVLASLSRRAGGVSLLLALAEAALGGGLAVMLAGYLAGGEIALPVAGALVGCGVASGMRRLPSDRLDGALGVGVVALFGVLFIGHFFGRLSGGRALAIFLAPLLCWTAELPLFSRQPMWRTAALRLALVAIPLIVVLALAKRDFDRDTLPLLAGMRIDS